MADDRALAVRPALARAGSDGAAEVAAEERRLRETLDEVTQLDEEVEALSASLADFGRRYEAALCEAFADLAAAERLVRRLQALEDALGALAQRLREGAPAPDARRRVSRRRRAPEAPRTVAFEVDEPPDLAPEAGGDEAGSPQDIAVEGPPELEPAEVALKRLYRRLARVLHPDLARDDGERARLSELMARVNASYAKGDLTALEVMAERLGAGEPLGELAPGERLAHLERRIATLARIAASLGRERDRLLRSDTHRLQEESRRRAEAGGDLVQETRLELAEEAAAAYADGLARLDRVAKAAREVSRARDVAMTKIVKRGPTGARRAFDPLAEGQLVRMGAARLERQRATAGARELARRLEDLAASAPWDVALTLLAFFAEDAGGRPPDALAKAEGWTARWELVRARWPDAPPLAKLLARLPRHLVLGARAQGDDVVAGVQLAQAELAAGVRIATERAAVAAIARQVLAALGPDEACAGCGAKGPALHLYRTRGLDERHGLACAGCGAVLRSYWRYGEVDGLDALASHALRLGLVQEVTAQLAGTAIGFQLLPVERERLTADRLRRRFADLYLAPYEVELDADALSIATARGPLSAASRVDAERGLRIVVDPVAGVTDEALLELLRVRIERRFRP